MERVLIDKVIEGIRGTFHPLQDELEQQVRKLLSPHSFESLSELTYILKPRPPYLGPGIWLRAIGSPRKGEDHA